MDVSHTHQQVGCTEYLRSDDATPARHADGRVSVNGRPKSLCTTGLFAAIGEPDGVVSAILRRGGGGSRAPRNGRVGAPSQGGGAGPGRPKDGAGIVGAAAVFVYYCGRVALLWALLRLGGPLLQSSGNDDTAGR
jgi:hypothetical protein